jgi:hypothetical protein
MIPRARLDDINEAVIRQLIDSECRESRTLDYKEQLDLSKDGRHALAEDVCAFANTVGGDLVFGMAVATFDGDSAVASGIRPIVVDDLDAELLKLTSFLRDAVEPRVTPPSSATRSRWRAAATSSCYACQPARTRRTASCAAGSSTCATLLERNRWASTRSAPPFRSRTAWSNGPPPFVTTGSPA